MSDNPKPWDVFVSYASEDRDAVAAPLASLLSQLGLSVWFDQTELKVGDSLREKMDDGLARSRYGIVVLSEAFFSKHWPVRELNGLEQREAEGRKVLLPVWYGIDDKGVRSFSPPLADRVALKWQSGLHAVAVDLVDVIRPDISAKIRSRASRLVVLTRIETGKELAQVIANSHMFQFFNDGPQDRRETDQVAAFLQDTQDWGDIWDDIGAGGRVEAELTMHESLVALTKEGWSVYGGRTKRKVKLGTEVTSVDVAALAVVKGAPPVVFMDGDRAMVPRPSPGGT
jgi:hypothetical protein